MSVANERVGTGESILMPLPAVGFDPTEAAVTWKILTERGYEVVIATPDGCVPEADPIMVTGRGLALLKRVLRADANGRAAYAGFRASPACRAPLSYEQAVEVPLRALVLPGGHAKEMRPYLESEVLQRIIVRACRDGIPVAAICHGVLLAARSIDPETSRSVLYGKKVTTLPAHMELLAHRLTMLWMGDYYRTYPETTTEAEVRSFLATSADFDAGPKGTTRDTPSDVSRGFVVQDGNLITGRWPGDAHRFGIAICDMLAATSR